MRLPLLVINSNKKEGRKDDCPIPVSRKVLNLGMNGCLAMHSHDHVSLNKQVETTWSGLPFLECSVPCKQDYKLEALTGVGMN